MSLLKVENSPSVVYYKNRGMAWVKGNWLATGTNYFLYNQEKRCLQYEWTKACIIPTRVEAEYIASKVPHWEVMSLEEAETLFSKYGDRRP